VKHPIVRNAITVIVISIGVLIIIFSLSGAWAGVQAMLNPPDLESYDGFMPLEVAVARGEITLNAPTLVAEVTPTPSNDSPVEVEAPIKENKPPAVPDRIVIESIGLDAPVIKALERFVVRDGKMYQQWQAPNEPAVGWHPDSAPLGEIGNTVLNGHHNVHGEVFRYLVDVKAGDQIVVYSKKTPYRYIVVNYMILPERLDNVDQRLANALWIMPSKDERLTLITCYPYDSNTHRLIIVARPAE